MLERLTVGPIGENAYVLIADSSCLLVDPGDEAPRILSFLDSRGLVPDLIVATHGHLDHTAAIPELLAAWSGRGIAVPLAAHAADADYFGAKGRGDEPEPLRRHPRPRVFQDLLAADPRARASSSPTATRYRAAPTASSTARAIRGDPICLYDEAASILVSGDTLFRDGFGRTDGPDSDPAALDESLRRLFALPPSTRVFPGHGEETTIGRESATLMQHSVIRHTFPTMIGYHRARVRPFRARPRPSPAFLRRLFPEGAVALGLRPRHRLHSCASSGAGARSSSTRSSLGFGQIEDELTVNKPGSRIDAVNAAAGSSPVAVGPDAMAILKRDLELSAWSDGAFDPSVGPLVKLWGIGTDHARLPEPKEIAAAKSLVGWKDIVLDKAKGTVFLRRKGMALDLGSTIKGFAADEVAKLIRAAGVKGAVIDLGGNVYVVGSRPDGKTWRIGLQDPFSDGEGGLPGHREPLGQDDGHLGRLRALLLPGRQALPPHPRYEDGLSGGQRPHVGDDRHVRSPSTPTASRRRSSPSAASAAWRSRPRRESTSSSWITRGRST